MKSRFLLSLFVLGAALGAQASAETLWIKAENNNLEKVDGSVNETIVVQADSTIGKVENTVNFINVQANLTVNSDLDVNQINMNQYQGNDSLTVKGNLTVNGQLNVDKTHSVTVSGTTTLNGGTTVSQLTGSAKLTTQKLVINGQTKLSAGGHIVADEVVVNHTFSPLSGSTISTASGEPGALTVKEGGHVWQQGGAITMATVVDGGQMTMYGGSFDSLELKEGTLNVNGDIATGALTLNGGEVIFSEGASLDLGGESLVLSDNVTITIKASSLDAIVSQDYVLFTNVEDIEGADLTINIDAGDAGTSTVKLAMAQNGSVVVVVPEPATATLSLLALCGLAARRRRK